MNPGCRFRRRPAFRWSLPVALSACALLPGAALAGPLPGPLPLAEDGLSPRLTELAKPELRAAPLSAQAARLSLAGGGAGSLLRDGGRVLVDARFSGDAAAAAAAIQATGAELVELSGRYRTATVAARPAQLRPLARLGRVDGVTPILAPLVRGADCGGLVRSEGDAQLHADNARASFGVDGTGVTVGILSDSFDRDPFAVTHAPQDVAGGDLPGPGSPCGSTDPVGVLDDSEASGGDEGRAMAQIVHDLAPGTAIDFATAFTGELQFAANIRALAAAGAGVIADDVSYPEEPFFQDGPVAVAAGEVAAAGVSYFSAAGNDNLVDEEGNAIASWEAPAYRDSGSCPEPIVELSEAVEEAEAGGGVPVPVGLRPGQCLDFDPAEAEVDQAFGITVEPGATLRLDLQWAEPWNGVGTDLDAFLLGEDGKLLEAGEAVVASAERNVAVSQKPVEFLAWKNPGPAAQQVQLVVNRFEGSADPRVKFALLQNGGGVSAIERPQSSGGDVVGPTIFGHAGSAAVIGTGAVRFNAGFRPESFSSHGPVSHYFGPVLGAAPAPALAAPKLTAKPDLVAADGTANTFFGPFQGGAFRFFGTSAAAPHAAAVAALVRQANPGASAAQVRAALSAGAKWVGTRDPNVVGAGLIDAYAAVQALVLPPTVKLTRAPAPLSRERQPTIEFSANRRVSFSCEVDGGAPRPCASPYRVPLPLADGTHGIAVLAVDDAGQRANSGSVSFTVDTKPPRARIARHPRKLIRTRRIRALARFRFRSEEPDTAFVCKVDRGLLRFCGSRFQRRFGPGKHVLRVRGQDRAGNVDRRAAVFRFRVKRVG